MARNARGIHRKRGSQTATAAAPRRQNVTYLILGECGTSSINTHLSPQLLPGQIARTPQRLVQSSPKTVNNKSHLPKTLNVSVEACRPVPRDGLRGAPTFYYTYAYYASQVTRNPPAHLVQWIPSAFPPYRLSRSTLLHSPPVFPPVSTCPSRTTLLSGPSPSFSSSFRHTRHCSPPVPN